MNILIYYASLTGNTYSFIDYVKKEFPDNKYTIVSEREMRKSPIDMSKFDKIMIGTYTWSTGKIPNRVKRFIIDNREILKDKKPLIFGSGITIYPHFCGAVDNIEIIIDEDLTKIRFELTFEPKENGENIKLLREFMEE